MFKDLRDLVYTDDTKIEFTCNVFIEDIGMDVPYSAKNNSGEERMQAIWDAGQELGVADYVPPPIPLAEEPQPVVDGAQTL